MKITKGRLREIIQEEMTEEYSGESAGNLSNGGGGVGSFDSMAPNSSYGGPRDDLSSHAEGIASSYGKIDDDEVKARIEEVLDAMISEEMDSAQASSLLTDMLYQLVDKEDHEENAMAEGDKEPMKPKGIDYYDMTSDEQDGPKTSAGRNFAKRKVSKTRRQRDKKAIATGSQMNEHYVIKIKSKNNK